jgi:uncharacterized protein (DUF2141 family)
MRVCILLALAFLLWTCANVSAPTGGPKDETPPKLISSIPKQGQTNYPGKGVTLEFDEFLKLKNPKEEIIITPDVKDAKFIAKKNLFLIEFPEKLADSTTYSIAFREAIHDLNEGNPAEDLHLAFSTGSVIDSLKIEGTVNQLKIGAPAEKYTVAVYTQDTFDIFKHKPVYFTRTNKEGKFSITNLKAGKYFIYAWDDKNKNLSLQSQSEKFGFLPDTLNLTANIDSLEIQTLALDARPITVTGIRSLGHFTKVRLNKNVVTYSLKSLDAKDKKINHSFSGSQSEIDIFPNKPAGDSTLITLSARDSLNQTKDSTFYLKQTTAKSLKEKIKLSPSKLEVQEETQKLTGQLKLSELIKAMKPDSIYVRLDSIRIVPFVQEEITFDTIYRSVKLSKTFLKSDSIDWKQARLIFGGGAFSSIFGDSSKQTPASISLIKAQEMAVLIIESPAAKPNTILEIVNDKLEVIASLPHSKITTFKNLPASTFMLRAIIDSNKNGKWDNGNPNQKTLPEKIIYYLNREKKKQIPLRANWEVPIVWNF